MVMKFRWTTCLLTSLLATSGCAMSASEEGDEEVLASQEQGLTHRSRELAERALKADGFAFVEAKLLKHEGRPDLGMRKYAYRWEKPSEGRVAWLSEAEAGRWGVDEPPVRTGQRSWTGSWTKGRGPSGQGSVTVKRIDFYIERGLYTLDVSTWLGDEVTLMRSYAEMYSGCYLGQARLVGGAVRRYKMCGNSGSFRMDEEDRTGRIVKSWSSSMYGP